MGAKILLVEDELHIAKLIIHHANKDGYSVDHVTRGDEAISNYSCEDYDLVILDLMLPGLDGLEVCRKLREKSNRAIPIIMLTAKDEEIDKVIGLEMGADDYMTKPFSPRELMARIKAQLRIRESISQQSSNNDQQDLIDITIADFGISLRIDTNRYRVFFGDQELNLTRKEFELLKLLAVNSGQVMTREMLLERIWGYDYIGDTRTVDVHIRYLRQKLKQNNCSHDLIETVRGVGYRLKEME